MSSMRNAVQRRPHKERAQPLERRRLGLLEKHKDYSLRAADYNKKKATLKSLRDKAAERNDDEFYFGMMSRKGPGSKLKDGKRWVGTVRGDRGNKAMDVETVRLLKTQDLGYVRTMKQIAAKELARLQEKVVLARGLDWLAGEEEGADEDEEEEEDEEDEEEDEEGNDKRGATTRSKGPRKIVFVDDEAEREILLDQLSLKNNNKADSETDQGDSNAKDDQKAQRQKDIKNLKRELEHARKKVRVLEAAENELEIQQTKMAKTATSGGFTRRGKKIMVRRRKR